MYKRILVGTDGSATAGKAVDRAVELAKASGASLTILTAGVGDAAQQVVDEEAHDSGGSLFGVNHRDEQAVLAHGYVPYAFQGSHRLGQSVHHWDDGRWTMDDRRRFIVHRPSSILRKLRTHCV